MSQSSPPFRPQLLTLLEKAGIPDLETLKQISGLSGYQVSRIQHGLLAKMSVEALIMLTKALNLPISEVLAILSPALAVTPLPIAGENLLESKGLREDYDRLKIQLEQQKEQLQGELQQQVLQTLEPWLLQWPTAAAKAQQDPAFPAQKLLPLVRPLANLLTQWQVEAIASVGAIVEFDPQHHQLMAGEQDLTQGTRAIVRYVGYRQGKKLLYRAQVSALLSTPT
ncbi:MAG: nucleotide exchange factor GrpE [Microcystaceae cyanobacterium]